ncbi:MAG: adenosylcobalamin-dependent ribonucleoside-diphosphate reductase [bacterium]|nr:adenosylcobalamin-dependent ribonucleoside-diphosphate reductase [bacterium]
MSTGEAQDISWQIWDMKYRYRAEDGTPLEGTVEETWRRVARGLAIYERDRGYWEERFFECLKDYKFLPGGRILANAGTPRKKVTMFNCYVLNTIEDSMEGIFATVRNAALTQKQGGGIGMDFSTLRPQGAFIRGCHATASGPVSFMRVFDATCRTILSAGQRRGAQMAVLSCRHPDIEAFIDAKRDGQSLQMFNLSVAITDEFIEAVKEDRNWDLVFDGKVYKTVRARDLWQKIMRSTYDYAEPGFILIDRINAMNNLYYCEEIRATNPCGEQPLPPFGACLLGSVNLTRFVQKPFTREARVDFEGIRRTVEVAVRLLDNTIDISNYPLEQQRDEAQRKRRMGIGITGLGDALVFLGVRYGSAEAQRVAGEMMKEICHTAYRASIELAKEKGSFPMLDKEKYLRGKFIEQLPEDIRAGIAKYGIRNSHLTSIAPTGTISLFAGNISSGLEPIFAFSYVRKVRTGRGDETVEQEVCDYAYRMYRDDYKGDIRHLPEYFVTTDMITPREHVDMQAALQPYVDSSISKTINVPTEFPFEQFEDIYMYAYERGLKGCTTFRPNERMMGVLVRKEEKKEQGSSGEVSAGESEFIQRRPIELYGKTYKIKTPLLAQSLYITINDIREANGRLRPFEIFINCKNLQHFSWMVAMTRLISAVFRRTSDPSFLVEELKSIFDPNGGYFREGRYVPSLVAEIGEVIEEHLRSLGIGGGGEGRQERAGTVVSAKEGEG